MDEQLLRLKSWLNRQKKGPHSLDIVPTNKCNLSCTACFQRAPKKKGYFDNELPIKKYKQIIDEASKLNVKVINILGGGEPFLRKDIMKIMHYVKKKDMYGYIVTNGTLLKTKTIGSIVKIGWDAIAISLDASDAKTHDYLRQKKGSFDRIIMAIKAINEEKAKQKKEKPKIIINYLITNLNYNRIVDLVGLCNKLKVQEINLINMLVCSKNGNKLALDKNQYSILNAQLKLASKRAHKAGIKNNFNSISEFIEKEKIDETKSNVTKKNKSNEKKNEKYDKKLSEFLKVVCLRPWLQMNITADGFVGICPLFSCKENIKQASLNEIWFGKTFEKTRNNLLSGILSKDCGICCAKIIDEELQEKFVEFYIKNRKKNRKAQQ